MILVNLFDSIGEEEVEDEEETETSDDSEIEDEEDDDRDRERCPNGYHRSPSGDCERVRDFHMTCPDVQTVFIEAQMGIVKQCEING